LTTTNERSNDSLGARPKQPTKCDDCKVEVRDQERATKTEDYDSEDRYIKYFNYQFFFIK